MLVNFLIVSLLSIGILYEWISRSPEGYQDENGFHYGKGVDKD
jgi:hypothetical protein